MSNVYDKLNAIIQKILLLLLPAIIKGTIVVIAVYFVGYAAYSVLNFGQHKVKTQLANNAGADLDDVQTEFIDYGNQKYYLPMKPNLTKSERRMLMAIYVPEWGSRKLSSLDGDLDSVCMNQQRVSELYSSPHLIQAFKDSVGDDVYNDVLNTRRQNWIHANIREWMNVHCASFRK